MSAGPLRVAVVYPDLLGTYGDGGNGTVLCRRAQWRGLEAEVVAATSDRPLPAADLYCLGGGEDAPQVQAARLLGQDGTLAAAVGDGAVVLAVCAGYQIAGAEFPDATGAAVEGLGLLDVTTAKGPGTRPVGELLARVRPGPWQLPVLSGFENHAGLTTVGQGADPLADVLVGVGNGDGTEGAWAGRVVGTYAHGPVLARNPALADLLLEWATGQTLEPIDDHLEEALRAERIAAAGGGRGRRRR